MHDNNNYSLTHLLKVMSDDTKVSIVRNQGTQCNLVALVVPTGFASGIASIVQSSGGGGGSQYDTSIHHVVE